MTLVKRKGCGTSAICQGPAGFLDAKLSNGTYLINGKKEQAFLGKKKNGLELKKRGVKHSIKNFIHLATCSYYPVVNIPQEMPVTVFLKRGKSFLFMASI